MKYFVVFLILIVAVSSMAVSYGTVSPRHPDDLQKCLTVELPEYDWCKNYKIKQKYDPDINSIDENNLQGLRIFTVTNATGIMEENIPYNRTCPEDTDWPDAPNRCDRRENYTRTQLKNLYDEYYQYKGTQWMETKKSEMDSVIASGLWRGVSSELWYWLGHTQHEIPFENINVYLYYFLNGQAPDVGWGWYSVNDEFEPVITLYYASPGAIMMISSIIVIGAIAGVILSFKGINSYPKRKIFAIIGFVLIFVGVTVYSVSLFEIIQSQINKMNGQEFLPILPYIMYTLFGIPIALAGIPVILRGVVQKFSNTLTVLTLFGLISLWFIFFIWGLD